MKNKKIALIILLIILVIIGFKYKDFNLIFATEKEKNEIKESIYINTDVKSFKPLSYTESILGFNGDNAKILVFDISKDDYESNNLHYSDESIGALAYGTNKEDMGDYYKCKIKLDNVDTAKDYENLRPFSIVNLILESLYIICIVIILVNIFMNVKKSKIVVIVATSIIVLLFSCFFYSNYTRYIKNRELDNSSNDYSFLKARQSQEVHNIDEEKNDQSNINNKSQDITQKILSNQVVNFGTINKIDDNYIYYSTENSINLYFEKNTFSYSNGRTCKKINLEDVKVGDYIHPFEKQILVYRNLSGEELNQELLYNLTLTEDERIYSVNSISIEEINIENGNTAIVKISYGDIIGDDLTNERFSTLVEFNSNTKYYSKGNNINSVNDLEIAKGNINSILLKKDSINKKSPAIALEFESTDN